MAQMYTAKNAKDVEKFIQEKQQLEWDLAKNIMGVFDQPELIKELRFYADSALANLIEIVTEARDASILLNKAIVLTIDGERTRTLKVLKEYKGPPLQLQIDAVHQLMGLRQHLNDYDAAIIMEIIRLYGGVIEAVAKGPAKDAWEKSAKFYKEKKTKIDDILNAGGKKAHDELGALVKDLDGYIEKKLKGDLKGLEGIRSDIAKAAEEIIKNKKLDALREGMRKAGGTKEEALDYVSIWKVGRARWSSVFPDQVEKFNEARKAWGVGNVQAELDKLKGGQSLFSLKDSSTIGKIDHVYGLVPASDISGTTTDTLFFWQMVNCGDPIFSLLPLGPVVANGHHSFVECAVALSLAGTCDYSIGKYTTVMPDGAKLGKGAMLKVLQDAEKDPRNRRMIIAYDGSKKPPAIEHAWVFDAADKRFDAFANWRRNMEFFKKAKGDPEGWFKKDVLEAELKKATLVT